MDGAEGVWSDDARTRAVQEGALAWSRAVVLDVEAGGEADTLRRLLEQAGLAVELYGIGQPRHLAAALAGQGIGGRPEYLAPPGAPEGVPAMLLMHMLFYGLTSGWSLSTSLERARQFDPRLGQWSLWSAS